MLVDVYWSRSLSVCILLLSNVSHKEHVMGTARKAFRHVTRAPEVLDRTAYQYPESFCMCI